jgi:hypothetical protein
MLLDAPDTDFGQAWNMPCAPTRSPRALLSIGAAALGQRLRVWAVPFALLRPLRLVYRFAKEVADVGFTWDRPYVVDGGKSAGSLILRRPLLKLGCRRRYTPLRGLLPVLQATIALIDSQIASNSAWWRPGREEAFCQIATVLLLGG